MQPSDPSDEPEAQDRPDFERSLEELEALVGKMEKGDLSLEDSLAQFERGIALTRTCQQALREAEQKIDKLVGPGGEGLAPFAEREDR
ncbi:MAG: exodeoxyribonuclease VII small subunit [Pseudomonadota bacterium]